MIAQKGQFFLLLNFPENAGLIAMTAPIFFGN